jgi:hypothetical protein
MDGMVVERWVDPKWDGRLDERHLKENLIYQVCGTLMGIAALISRLVWGK